MRLAFLSTVLAGIAIAGPAAADDSARAHAAERFKAAQLAWSTGQYAAAAEAFTAADAFVPNAGARLNAAEAWERAGELDRAATVADTLIGAVDERAARAAAGLLARVKGRIATLSLSGSPDARVQVGDQIASPPRKLRLKPGSYAVSVSGIGAVQQRISIEAGEERAFDAGRAPPPVPPAPAPIVQPEAALAGKRADASQGVPALTWVSFGLGAASLGAAGIFAARTLSTKNDYEASATPELRDDFYQNRKLTNVALAAAGIFTAAGVVLILTSGSSGERSSSTAGQPPVRRRFVLAPTLQPRVVAGSSAGGVVLRGELP